MIMNKRSHFFFKRLRWKNVWKLNKVKWSHVFVAIYSFRPQGHTLNWYLYDCPRGTVDSYEDWYSHRHSIKRWSEGKARMIKRRIACRG